MLLHVVLSAKGPSTTSEAALALFYYLQLDPHKEKFLPLLHVFLCYRRGSLQAANIDIPFYSFTLLTCRHHSSECTGLGTVYALGNFLASNITIPGVT